MPVNTDPQPGDFASVTPIVIYRCRYENEAYEDFWGLVCPGYVIYDRARLTPIDETHAYSNGYESYEVRVYADEAGRKFYRHYLVDGVNWSQLSRDPADPGHGLWEHFISTQRRWVRDGQPVLGQTLCDEQRELASAS